MVRKLASLALLTVVSFTAAEAQAADPIYPFPLVEAAQVGELDKSPVLSEQDLAGIIGGEGVELLFATNQNLRGTTSHNTITTDTLRSGAISFSDEALKGFSGIGNFVINTGHQNVLQGSLSVTVLTPVAQ